MRLEQQVISLELAKRLKELGVKQDSQFYYVNELLVFKTDIGCYAKSGAGVNDKYLQENEVVAAYDAAELGEMLPYEIDGKLLDMSKGSDGTWSVYYTKNALGAITKPTFIEDQGADTEADARAKMLVYLIENRLLTV